MTEDAGTLKGAVVGVVVLDRIEHNRQARELAPDGDRRRNTVHIAGELHVHQDRGGRRGQAVGQRGIAAAAGMDDTYRAGRVQPRTQGRAEIIVIFDEEQVDHSRL